MSANPLPDDPRALEAQLARLTPAPLEFDRQRLLYDAGYAAGRADAARGVWPIKAAAALLLCVSLAWLAVRWNNTPPVAGPVIDSAPALVHVEPPIPAPAAVESPRNYLWLRQRALLEGADALPNVPFRRIPGDALPMPHRNRT